MVIRFVFLIFPTFNPFPEEILVSGRAWFFRGEKIRQIEIYYCDPSGLAGYHGCGKVARKEECKPRNSWKHDNLLAYPHCGKGGTNTPIGSYMGLLPNTDSRLISERKYGKIELRRSLNLQLKNHANTF